MEIRQKQKKPFEVPKAEVILFDGADIICVSNVPKEEGKNEITQIVW